MQGCESSDFNLSSNFLLFTEFHFQTVNALKTTSFQAFRIISDFQTVLFAHTLSHTCNKDEIVLKSIVSNVTFA